MFDKTSSSSLVNHNQVLVLQIHNLMSRSVSLIKPASLILLGQQTKTKISI